MKKTLGKSFGLILTLLMLWSISLFSACGKKYDKMEFNVQYAFSEDATEWYDVDDSISCTFGDGEENIKIDPTTGLGTIYIKVEIDGVKAKNVGDIIVTKLASGAPNFSSVTLKEGEVFSIDIHKTEKIQNSLKFYETQSKKSKTIDIEIYQELTEIRADLSINPAVMIGGSVDLKRYKNISFLSNGLSGLVSESQKRVDYSILSAGYYDASGVYIKSTGYVGLYADSLSIEDGVLSVSRDYLSKTNADLKYAYIVRVLASSKTNTDVSCEFDVYVVDSKTASFDMDFTYSDGAKIQDGKFTLYPGSEDYSKIDLVVDYTGISQNDCYVNAGMKSNTILGNLKYVPVVYINGLKINDKDKVSHDKGLAYSYVDTDLKRTYTFTMLDTVVDTYNVEVRMEIDGLNFAHATKAPNYSTRCSIDKKYLPSEILLNNKEDYVQADVFMKDDEYSTLELNVNTLPEAGSWVVGNLISVTTSAKIDLKYGGNRVTLGAGETKDDIAPGSVLFVTLDKDANLADLTFKIKTTPDKFEGVDVTPIYQTKTFRINGKVTARNLTVFADRACTIRKDTNNALLVDANNQTSFYVKVEAVNINNFAPDTVTLTSGGALKLSNNLSTINLADSAVVRESIDITTSTSIYRVNFAANGTMGVLDTITISKAGYDSLQERVRFAVKSVNTVEDETSIKVVTSNSFVEDLYNSNTYFALQHGYRGELKVVGDVNGGVAGDVSAINSIVVSKNDEYDLDTPGTSGEFSQNAIILRDNEANPINLTSVVSGKTTAFKIKVTYYKNDAGVIKQVAKANDINIQVATYTPIVEINANFENNKDEIVYINEYFAEAAIAKINFSTNVATTELNFDNFATAGISVDATLSKKNNTANTVSGIVFATNNTDSNIKYYTLKQHNETIVSNNSLIKEDGSTLLNGTIYVELIDVCNPFDIEVSLVASKFGEEQEEIAKTVTIKVRNHANEATNISLSGNELRNEGDNSTYIYMKDSSSVEFTATSTGESKYKDLTYKIYSISKDEQGNILYQDGVAEKSAYYGAGLEVANEIDKESYMMLDKDGKVILSSGVNGGLYLLEIRALDSYDDDLKEFKNVARVFVSVSDGTEQYPYILRNKTNFEGIEADKHYVLGRDFDNTSESSEVINLGQISAIEEEFKGSIKGRVEYLNSELKLNKTTRYSLKYNAENKVVGENNYLSLFVKAGSVAKFENFDIIASYNNMSIEDDKAVYIAGLVGDNSAAITNVGLTISSSAISTKGVTYFGGLTATNTGAINMINETIIVNNLIVNVEKGLTFGLISATNAGSILANYQGISSLDTLKYSVLGNVSITSSSTETLNIGGLVGTMTNGTIKNVLLGGKIVVAGSTNAGYLAGIVGNLTGDSDVDTKEVETVATFALDLIGSGHMSVAGIAGSSQNSSFEDVRIESAKVDFASLGLTTTGKIVGSGDVVAGAIADSTGDNLNYIAVESFIDSIGDATFYMLENTKENGQVYGLVKGLSNVSYSFVDASLKADEIVLTSTGINDNTYFIGSVKEYTDGTTITLNKTGTYFVIYDEATVEEGGTIPASDGAIWEEYGEYNAIMVADTKHVYPYLLKDGRPFMIVRPTGLKANLNETKIEEYNSLYIKEGQDGVVTINKVDMNYTTDEISEIAIINYYNDINNPLNNESLNNYLITDLISREILPDVATGAVMFDLIYGARYARIDGNRIYFLGVSGNSPIIVKCYSALNSSLVEYVVFFTEFGFTDIVIDANNTDTIVDGDERSYAITINTSPNSSDERIEINAENFKEDFCESIFGANNDTYGVSDFLEVETTIADNDVYSQVTVTEENFDTTKDNLYTEAGGVYTKISPATFADLGAGPHYALNHVIKIQQVNPEKSTIFNLSYAGAEFDSNKVELDVTFEIKLNLTKYFGEAIFPGNQTFSLGNVSLLVTVVKTATSMTISDKPSEVSIDSSLSFTAVMETGYFKPREVDNTSVMYTVEDNTILLEETDKDSMYFTFSAETGYEEQVGNLLSQAGVDSIVELFNTIDIKFSKNISHGKQIGYIYTFRTIFKNEYKYRYITEDIKIKVFAYSKFNYDVKDEFVVTIKPAALDSAEIKNYTISGLETGTEDLGVYRYFDVEKSDSYIISPGSRGGIMVINLEPRYANLDWDNVTLTSSPLYVPDLGRTVYLSFEQVAYNANKGRYETIPYSDYHYDNNGNLIDISVEKNGEKGIKLFPYSQVISGNNTEYTGQIYIYVALTHFAGLSETITATLTAPTIENGEEKTIETKLHLVTQYLPGVVITYNGQKKEDGYLIQELTNNNVLSVKLFGYQFITAPGVEFNWVDGNDEYARRPVNSATEFNSLKADLYVKEGDSFVSAETLEYSDTQTYFEFKDINDYISYRIDGDNIIHNIDGSTSMNIYIYVYSDLPSGFDITVSIRLMMEDGQTISEKQARMRFYPVDYMLNSIAIEDINTVVNTNNMLRFSFATDSQTNDYTDEIYDIMFADIVSGSNYNDFAEAFSYMYKGYKTTFKDVMNDSGNNYPEFEVRFLNYSTTSGFKKTYPTILANNTINTTVTFTIYYGYEKINNRFELTFGKQEYIYQETFELRIDANTTEENAKPIDNAEDFVEFMTYGAGQDFILTNDIVLEDYAPIATEIASLDGNNKVITIKSFATSANENAQYGLFSSFGTCTVKEKVKQAILKNVVVDYSSLDSGLIFTKQTTSLTFGGLVAINNGGLIYNCDVINLSGAEKTVNLYIEDSTSAHSITFGGLVGINNESGEFKGTITNSRVGRDGFTKVSVDTYGNVSVNDGIVTSKLNFIVGYHEGERQDMNGFVGIVGGVVGENAGTISSTYISNTSIINYSTASTSSKTAGFVAENSGNISYSYVQADPDTMTNKNPYATGAKIESATSGKVAGFVFTNSGTISDCYTNTVLVTHANFMAGFAYENSGTLKQSYAASILNSNSTNETDASEQPFIGSIDVTTTLSTGRIENCYYYKDADNFNIKTVPVKNGYNQALGLSLTNFRNSEMLGGFVFVLATSREESEQGVWSYYTADNKYRLLPELNSPNFIATSYRYLTEEKDNVYKYRNAIGFEQGTKVNPYIIRNVEEYNQVMVSGYGTKTSAFGYIRFISDIDFTGREVSTHANFTLGSDDVKNKTSIDGNGMTLSGIYLDAPSKNIEAIGMFANIKNAFVKNLNLSFDEALYSDKFSSISVKFSGGLAGKIENSVVINVNLEGRNTTLAGSNAVGGLAGVISGRSMIYGVRSNLSVIATGHDTTGKYNLYYNQTDFNAIKNSLGFTQGYNEYMSTLCYAGGLAGIIDIEKRGTEKHNIAYINIMGSEMMTSENANISADYVGGVAGYVGQDTSSYRLKYYTGQTDKIVGGYVAGGLYGVGFGDILASQVTAVEGENDQEEDTQYIYDTNFGSYIKNLNDNADASLNKSAVGNLSLIRSTKYAGGLIGIGIDATINSSYSKASFASAEVIGGLIGVSVSSSVSYSYAVVYVNVDMDTISDQGDDDTDAISLRKVGGLIGIAYGDTDDEREESATEWIEAFNRIPVNDRAVKVEAYKTGFTNIDFTFSTLLLDHTLLEIENSAASAEEKERIKNLVDDITIDYICADFKDDTTTYLKSDNDDLALLENVFAGFINVGERYINNISCLGGVAGGELVQNVATVDLYMLYDVEYSEHDVIFNKIFSTWPVQYWVLDSNRYFPLLIEQTPKDYIEIWTATDIHKLVNNPNADFLIKADINMADYTGNTVNSIVKKPFTGTITGDVEYFGSVPAIYNIGIESTTDGANVGFFASSKKATFVNIMFVYKESGINLVSENNKIGGLVADDTGSSITNITVMSGNFNITSRNVSSVTQLFNVNDNLVSGFGGIVGSATDSSLMETTFKAKVQIKLAESGNFGGLVGTAKYAGINSEFDDIEGFEQVSTMSIVSSSASGATYEIEYSNANVGGLVGKMEESGTVVSESSLDNVKIQLYAIGNGPFNFGGLIGYVKDTQIKSNKINNSDLTVNSTNSINGITNIAGLVGYYSNSYIENEINQSHSELNIELHETNFTTLRVSQGVAEVGVGDCIIKSCLFTGDISETGDVGNRQNVNIHASGVIAYSIAGNLKLQEVMTTGDIIVGSYSTNLIIAGGLIAEAKSVKISHCVSVGRIVPTSAGYDPHNTQIFIGGFAGLITSSIEMNNSYTTTSLVTAGLADNVLQGFGHEYDDSEEEGKERKGMVRISALFGEVPSSITGDKIEKTFYSTDYALYPEESGLGVNVPAYEFAYGNTVATGVEDDGFWSSTTDKQSKLPYLTTLTNIMLEYEVLATSDDKIFYDLGHKNIEGNAYMGSALQPIVINNNSLDFDAITDNESNKIYSYFIISTTVDNLGFEGSLLGVLIGGEKEYKVGSLKSMDSVFGVVPKVEAQSAVSNLHVKISSGYSADLGFIAGNNEGVLFNCSAQGSVTQINATSSSPKIGLISYSNSGLIAYAYSTAEIKMINNSASLSGITYNNLGKVFSSYFTGYVGNDGNAKASGIVHSIEEDCYVYNCYMAGVIETINTGNSFSNDIGDSRLKGSNNYIDQWANIEFGIKEDVVESIDTFELMQKDKIKGKNWTTIISETNKDKDANSYVITEDNSGFARNFGYPIYNFNKKNQELNSLPYHLNTGTGITINDYFKIPHLGVLSIVQGMTHLSRNYMLIYDVDATGATESWANYAVGRGDGNRFKGTFITNKYFAKADVDINLDEACIIENLSGSGIFENIGDATIQYVKFGSMTALSNSGVIAQNVKESTVVNNIYFINDTELSGETGKTVGGLFGTIYADTEVGTIQYENIEGITIKGAEIAGVISATIESGTLTIYSGHDDDDGFAGEETNKTHAVNFSNCITAGGFVGSISGGSILGQKDGDKPLTKITIYTKASSTNLGGIAGQASGGTIENIIVKRPSIDSADGIIYVTWLADGFGALACEVSGTVSFTNCNINLAEIDDKFEQTIYIRGKQTTEAEQGFGVLFGKISGGEITVDGLKFSEKEDLTDLGGVLFNVSSSEAKSVYNVGGIAGRYSGGKVVLDGGNNTVLTATKINITGSGFENMGGVFGLLAEELDEEELPEMTYLIDGLEFATLQPVSGRNVGGLIGKATCSISDLNNKNHIVIPNLKATTAGSAKTIYNIGGVVGYMSGSFEISNLTNAGSIKYHNPDDVKVIKGETGTIEMLNIHNGSIVESEPGKFWYSSRMVSVGGVVGYAYGITATGEITNKATVQGYQNVGGVFGYVSNIKVLLNFGHVEKITGDGTTLTNTKEYAYFDFDEDANPQYTLIYPKEENLISGTKYYRKAKDEIKTLLTSGDTSSIQIIGALNVGGIVGCAENSQIYGARTKSVEIYGNVNVGGFAGYTPSGEYFLNTIGAGGENVNIKGIYYAVSKKHNDKQNKTEYFIPTGIGGFVGKNVPNEITDVLNGVGANLYVNTLQNVNITTTAEGWPSLQDDYDAEVDGSSVISQIKNKVLKTSNTTTLDEGTESPEFWSMHSGIGGFIGTTNSNSLGTDMSTNVLGKVTVSASLGINVGAYYGYYYNADSGAISSLEVPVVESASDLKVSGAYVIGGLIGYFDMAEGAFISGFAYGGTIDYGTVKVQTEDVRGMYVGGLFGRVDGNISDMSINAKITINTENDYYIGGLVGRFKGNMTSSGDASGWTGTSTTELTVEGDATENFGGLVGLLLVDSSAAQETKVHGKHNQWFTVNTVENKNYTDGETSYAASYDSSDGKIYATAIAYYVNGNKMSIAGTSDTSKITNSTPGPFGHSKGWAEEYTMFRRVQRNIPKAQNNGAEWDSIGVVYDAVNILAVNVGVGGANVNRYVEQPDGTYVREPKANDKGYIYYTVYQDGEGSVKLYSATGIASRLILHEGITKLTDDYDYDLNGESVGDEFVYQYHTVTKDKLANGLLSGYSGGWVKDNNHYDDNPNDQKIIRTYMGHNGSYSTGGFCGFGTESKIGYDYAVFKADDGYYYFFEAIFGHAYLNGKTYQYNGLNYDFTADDSNMSPSGYLFEVSGSLSSQSTTKMTFWQKALNWLKDNWVEILVTVLVTVATMGAGAGFAAAKAGKLLSKGYRTVVKIFKGVKKGAAAWNKAKKTVTIGKRMLKFAKIAGAAMAFATVLVAAVPKANQTFFDPTTKRSIGFMSSTYSRELTYTNGKLNYQADEATIGTGDMAYYWYSIDTPNDYYSKYYFKYNLEESDSEDILITYPHTETPGGTLGKDYYLYYIFKNGAYYVNQYAGEYDWVVDQGQPKGKEYTDFVSENGYFYVRGTWDATNKKYQIDGNKTALTFDGTEYKLNGSKWSEAKEKYGLKDDPTLTRTLYYVAGKETGWEDKYGTDLTATEGYAQYTANVKYALGSGMSGQMKYATLTKTTAPTGTKGVDYLEFKPMYWEYEIDNSKGEYKLIGGKLDEFELISEYESTTGNIYTGDKYSKGIGYGATVYYQFSTLADSGSATDLAAFTTTIHDTATDMNNAINIDTITYPVHAVEFTEATGNNINTETWYLAMEQNAGKGFEKEATYFWYEPLVKEKRNAEGSSNFETMSEITNLSQRIEVYNGSTRVKVEGTVEVNGVKQMVNPSYNDILTNYEDWKKKGYTTENTEEYKVYKAYNKVGSDIFETLWGDNEKMLPDDTIVLFDASGTETEVLFSVVYNEWDKYKDYYTANINDFKISNQFKVDDNGTTDTDDDILYGYVGSNVIDGVRVTLQDMGADRKYDSWKKNKYLAGPIYDFYTRYKFSQPPQYFNSRLYISYTYYNEADKKEETKHCYLVPENNTKSWPNNEGTTILIESVNLTFGSPKGIYLTNDRAGGTVGVNGYVKLAKPEIT